MCGILPRLVKLMHKIVVFAAIPRTVSPEELFCSYRRYFNTFHYENPIHFEILCVIHKSHDISCHQERIIQQNL